MISGEAIAFKANQDLETNDEFTIRNQHQFILFYRIFFQPKTANQIGFFKKNLNLKFVETCGELYFRLENTSL